MREQRNFEDGNDLSVDDDSQDLASRSFSVRDDRRWIARNLVHEAPIVVGDLELTELVRCLKSATFDKGHLLFREGASVPGVWIVRSGIVEISRGTGRDRRVVALLRDGDLIGDTWLLLLTPPPETARCATGTHTWCLVADDFRRLVATYPAIAIAWMCNLAHRVSGARGYVADLVGGSLRARVARTVMAHAEDGSVSLSQMTIAQMLGVQRTSLNKVLKDLEREGLITIHYSSLEIADPEGLARAAH